MNIERLKQIRLVDWAKLQGELDKLDGLPPYDSPSNPYRNDAFYAADIEKRYGRPIVELRKLECPKP